MTTVSEAAALIDRHISVWPRETVAIDAAIDRVLAQNVAAERDIPAFDRVTMDGIAVNAAHRPLPQRLSIVATQAAGVAPMRIDGAAQCVRVMTGAVLPQGTDTVIPIERVAIDGSHAVVAADAEVRTGQFVHRRGSDRPAGSVVLHAGTRLGPPELAVLASVGKASFAVSRIPTVGVVSTGDELVGVDEPIAAHQIRSSNGRAIEAALHRHRCGHATRRRLRDEPDGLLAALEALHETHDVLILSGGVSMGDFDFVPGALQHLGAELVFHRIEQKPGRPMWFGVSRAGKPIFALPGNPVSTLVCMARYVVPALTKALGLNTAPERAVLGHVPAGGPARFTWFVPVTLTTTNEGCLAATPHLINTSGDFASLAATDGIAELGTGDRHAGAVVQVFRW